MVYLGVFFDSDRLPTREQWESVAQEKGISLEFPPDFDPRQYWSDQDSDESNHPPLPVWLDGVHCLLQFGVYTLDSECFLDDDNRIPVKEGDLGVSFGWHESNRPNAIASTLAAATLALAADGVVEWQRVKGGWCRGAHAYKTLRNAALRELRSFAKSEAAKAEISATNLFGPPKPVTLTAKGLIKCPRCEWTFDPVTSFSWEGGVHLRCGQRIDCPENPA